MSEPLPAARVTGYFADEAAFVAACTAARAAGRAFQAFSPWPVHGLDQALGWERSWIGRPVLAVILLAAAGAMGFLVQSGVQDWPINVSGKPYCAPLLYVVPVLEVGLLGGAVVNLLAAFHACRLVPGALPAVEGVSDDRFAVVLDAAAAPPAELEAWLLAQGAVAVESSHA